MKFVNNILASEASQKKILDFDVSNQPISEFGLHCWRQIIFFHYAIEQDYFLSQIITRNFFRKNHSPPPPPQNIKWTLPNLGVPYRIAQLPMFYTVIPRNRPIKSPFTTRWGYGGNILDLNPGSPRGMD